MIGLKEYIAEASKSGKNLHLTHLEDRVIYGGVDGAREAINALRALRDMLNGNTTTGTDVTVKWDGAPAVFCGIDPSDGKFFVAKKGIFNKDPKVYKTHEDIDADTSGDLNAKLKVALDELSKLGIKGVIQGDLMFTDDKRIETIDGVKYITFQPNTIVYAVPVDSELGKRINKAKLGVVFHTSYSGDSFENMKASYKIDISKLKDTPSVWFQDASYRDISGKATMTQKESDQVTEAISKAGRIFSKISSTTLKQIQDNPVFAQEIETFNNTFVRAGQEINPKGHVAAMIRWYTEKYQKEIAKRSSASGKRGQEEKLNQKLAFFSIENSKNLELIFELQKAIVEAKLLIIRKLDSVKQISTFILTKNGFKVTGSEGFVAIDHLNNGAVKLVDRLQFSYSNFSPDVIKGWDR